MKYGFIGAGNMGSAIIRGMLANKVANPEDILIFETNSDRRQALAEELGIKWINSVTELAESCGVIIAAVKPNILESVLSDISATVKSRRPLLISIAAGKSIAFIERALGFEAAVVRVMPNVNASVCESVSALCFSASVSPEQRQAAMECFEAVGMAVELEEDKFSYFTALCGSAPAFAFLFIEVLAKSVHRHGIDKHMAVKLAAQMVVGSAKLVLESGVHPNELIDRVCSPGGVTIEGICDLAMTGFEASVLSGMEAMINKDKSM